MKGASKYDPVQHLDLEGDLIGIIQCPRMLPVTDRRLLRRRTSYLPCAEPASLVRFPDPYGLRSYCGEGHVEVLSPLSIPGARLPLKGPTD